MIKYPLTQCNLWIVRDIEQSIVRDTSRERRYRRSSRKKATTSPWTKSQTPPRCFGYQFQAVAVPNAFANRSMAAQMSSHIPRLVRVHMICTARNAIDPAIDTLDELQGSIAGAGAREYHATTAMMRPRCAINLPSIDVAQIEGCKT